jgi:hypothetical protein
MMEISNDPLLMDSTEGLSSNSMFSSAKGEEASKVTYSLARFLNTFQDLQWTIVTLAILRPAQSWVAAFESSLLALVDPCSALVVSRRLGAFGFVAVFLAGAFGDFTFFAMTYVTRSQKFMRLAISQGFKTFVLARKFYQSSRSS